MALYLKKYGKNIDKTKARVELIALVCLSEAIFKNINKKHDGK